MGYKLRCADLASVACPLGYIFFPFKRASGDDLHDDGLPSYVCTQVDDVCPTTSRMLSPNYVVPLYFFKMHTCMPSTLLLNWSKAEPEQPKLSARISCD
eukprot:5464965-Amphidinium_carterae.3